LAGAIQASSSPVQGVMSVLAHLELAGAIQASTSPVQSATRGRPVDQSAGKLYRISRILRC